MLDKPKRRMDNMPTGRHKKDTRTFSELTYQEQANSIKATTLLLFKEIKAHVAKANEEKRDASQVKITCMMMIIRALARLERE